MLTASILICNIEGQSIMDVLHAGASSNVITTRFFLPSYFLVFYVVPKSISFVCCSHYQYRLNSSSVLFFFLIFELSFMPLVYFLLHFLPILSLFLSSAAYKPSSVTFYTLTSLSNYFLQGNSACLGRSSQISEYTLHTQA